jgi:hypothetical protein
MASGLLVETAPQRAVELVDRKLQPMEGEKTLRWGEAVEQGVELSDELAG